MMNDSERAAYFVEIFPQSVIRVLTLEHELSGKPIPRQGYVVLTAVLFASSGWVNVVLWMLTGRQYGFSAAGAAAATQGVGIGGGIVEVKVNVNVGGRSTTTASVGESGEGGEKSPSVSRSTSGTGTCSGAGVRARRRHPHPPPTVSHLSNPNPNPNTSRTHPVRAPSTTAAVVAAGMTPHGYTRRSSSFTRTATGTGMGAGMGMGVPGRETREVRHMWDGRTIAFVKRNRDRDRTLERGVLREYEYDYNDHDRVGNAGVGAGAGDVVDGNDGSRTTDINAGTGNTVVNRSAIPVRERPSLSIPYPPPSLPPPLPPHPPPPLALQIPAMGVVYDLSRRASAFVPAHVPVSASATLHGSGSGTGTGSRSAEETLIDDVVDFVPLSPAQFQPLVSAPGPAPLSLSRLLPTPTSAGSDSNSGSGPRSPRPLPPLPDSPTSPTYESPYAYPSESLTFPERPE